MFSMSPNTCICTETNTSSNSPRLIPIVKLVITHVLSTYSFKVHKWRNIKSQTQLKPYVMVVKPRQNTSGDTQPRFYK